MSSIKYLNAVLTVIAVLLTLNLYVGWMGSPAGNMISSANPAQAVGSLPDAGIQRQEIVDQLKLVNVKLDALSKTLTDGSLRAQVEANPSK